MRKILLLLTLLSYTFLNAQIWSDDFNDADISDWTTIDSDGDTYGWDASDSFSASGAIVSRSWLPAPVGAITPDNWIISSAIDLTGEAGNLYLHYLTKVANQNWDEEVYTVYVATGNDIASFLASAVSQNETLGDLGNTGNYIEKVLDVSSMAGQTVYVAFRHHNVTDKDYIVIDDVKIDNDANTTPVVAPDAVSVPSPLDGATEVYIDPTDGSDANTTPDMGIDFEWTPAITGSPATSYKIYLGSSAIALNLLGETTRKGVTITGMQYSTTYFWQIIAKNEAGDAINSPIWTFTTAADSSASVDDNVLASSVSIYPNTVTDVFTIKNTSTKALTETTIYDVNGRVVLQERLNNLIGTKIMDVSRLTSGLYFVELKATNAKIVKKLIKK